MAIEMFTSEHIDFKINERKQYERIKKAIVERFKSGDARYCFIVDHIIGNKQYDIIAIKNDAIITIDLKSYKGRVIGSENGAWFVETRDGAQTKIAQAKNPFLQARDDRYQLLNYLNKKLPEISARFQDTKIYNVASVVCFETGSSYDIGQIDHKKNLWFNVSDESSLPDLIETTTSREFLLKDIEIDALLKSMKLQKLTIEKPKEKLDVSAKSVLASEDIVRVTERVVEDFGADGFTLADLSEIVDPEVAARYLKETIGKTIVEKIEGTNRFRMAEKWSDKMPEIEEDEDISSGSDIRRYSESDFWLRPKKPKEGKEYEGVYRGTIYHMDHKKNVWWRTGKGAPRIEARFSDERVLDELLQLKPQGGRFRITESREVLTKVYLDDQGYVSVYVGQLVGDIELKDFHWKPKGLKRGDLWPSVYDGATFSANTNKDVLIHLGDRKAYAKDGHEDLAKKFLEFRGKHGGGRFKVSENGCILTLMYKAPYPEKIRKQIRTLTPEEKNLIDIRTKTDRDGMVPIYVGNFKGNIQFTKLFDLHKEWTEEDDEEFIKRLGG